jgi:hypothetical protein
MNSAAPSAASVRPRRAVHRGACAAIVVSVMAIAYAIPVSSAPAEGPPAGSGEVTVSGGGLNANGVVTVSDQGGIAAEVLQGLTLPQLAALLKTTPAALVAQIESLPGASAVTLLLKELLANPGATLESVVNGLTAHGVNPAALKALINSLLAPVTETSSQLRSVLETALADLGLNGVLPAVAHTLSVATSTLESAKFLPGSTEGLASTLNTTVERLSSVLAGAGAITTPLISITPLVLSQVPGAPGSTTDLVGLPNGAGGVTLVTMNSTTPAAASPAGQPAATASPASPGAVTSGVFRVLSIRLTKGGLIVETVSVPGPGQLGVKATVQTRGASKASHARTRTVASAATNVAGGIRTITLRARGLANLTKRTPVTLSTTYTPTNGSAITKRNSVIFKPAVRKARKQKR